MFCNRSLKLTIFVIILTIFSHARATTILIEDPENVVRRSPVIAEVVVIKMDRTIIPKSALGYELIKLNVVDVIKGDAPKEIIIKRVGLNEKGEYLYADFNPVYTVGEKFIICLMPKEGEYYITMGLYHGKFVVENGFIQDTNFTLDDFKKMILEILDGSRSKFPAELPRLLSKKKNRVRSQNFTFLKASSGSPIAHVGSHLDGEFETFDETWDPSKLPIKFKYNHADNPGVNQQTVTDRIGDALDVWIRCQCLFLTFNLMAPQVKDK